MEELIEFAPLISMFYCHLIESSVGKEDTISYMIKLLRLEDNILRKDDNQKERKN
jgi:hypothetical protein